MTGLIKYEAARAALAEARGMDEVKEIHDRAEAMRAYGRMANDVQLELDAAEIRVRAERRLGILIDEQKTKVGLNSGQLRRGSDLEPRENIPTLAEAGIDKKLSSRSQKVAKLPEAEFERLVGDLRVRITEQGGRASLDLVNQHRKEVVKAQHDALIAGGGTVDDLVALAASGYRASVILADPPWHFMTRSSKGEGRSANQHYTTNPLDQIKALPVTALAAPDAVLLMWMVDWAPGAALDVMAAWGFEHKTTAFTWVKQNKSSYGMFMGQGYWTRANPESCWLATRGAPSRLNADVRQLIIAPLQEHSRKPDEIYTRVERLVVGQYLELYARRQRPGWTTWGNEIPHDHETGEIHEDETPQASDAPTQFAAEELVDLAREAAPIEEPIERQPIHARAAADDFEIPSFLRRTPEPAS